MCRYANVQMKIAISNDLIFDVHIRTFAYLHIYFLS